MGHDTAHWEGIGRIPPQVNPQVDREETLENTGWHMGLSPTGLRDDVGGTAGGGDLRLPLP